MGFAGCGVSFSSRGAPHHRFADDLSRSPLEMPEWGTLAFVLSRARLANKAGPRSRCVTAVRCVRSHRIAWRPNGQWLLKGSPGGGARPCRAQPARHRPAAQTSAQMPDQRRLRLRRPAPAPLRRTRHYLAPNSPGLGGFSRRRRRPRVSDRVLSARGSDPPPFPGGPRR